MPKKSTKDYLKAAKAGKTFVPSLKKYSRRKKLNRWEKAAITRATNKIAKARRGRDLQPLTEKQAKKINPNFIVGNGIRAMPIRASEKEGATIRVEKDGNVTLLKRRGKRVRRWHYEYLQPDPLLIADALESIQKRLRRNQIANVHVLTAAGIEGLGHTLTKNQEVEPEAVADALDSDDFEGLGSTIMHFLSFINKYSSLDPQFNDWFLGLAYFVQKI